MILHLTQTIVEFGGFKIQSFTFKKIRMILYFKKILFDIAKRIRFTISFFYIRRLTANILSQVSHSRHKTFVLLLFLFNQGKI